MLTFDFAALENDDFKEDSVRELIVAPLLKELGFVPKDSKNPRKFEMILSQRETADFQIGSNKNYKQVLSYAVGFNAKYFALCNGSSLRLFRLEGQEILLDVDLENTLQEKWTLLQAMFCGEAIVSLKKERQSEEWYLKRELPKAISKPQKRKKARHYGCTAYFTRQSWDIVSQNIAYEDKSSGKWRLKDEESSLFQDEDWH